jgi:hypothetical protein
MKAVRFTIQGLLRDISVCLGLRNIRSWSRILRRWQRVSPRDDSHDTDSSVKCDGLCDATLSTTNAFWMQSLGASVTHAEASSAKLLRASASVNARPTIPTNVTLPAIGEDTAPATNAGQTVSSIMSASGSIDVDGNSLGIAVTSVDNAHGHWQYSTNGGGSSQASSPCQGSTVPSSELRCSPVRRRCHSFGLHLWLHGRNPPAPKRHQLIFEKEWYKLADLTCNFLIAKADADKRWHRRTGREMGHAVLPT